MDTEALLKQGITAAQAGHKAEAWRLLAQVLHQDQRNELAWYWLSRVVDSQKQCVKCLKNVLMINPDNASARKKLAQLQSRADAPQAPPQPSTPPPTIRCLNCGATNRTGATFCKKCGQSLNQTKSSPATAPPVVLCPQCGAKNRVEAAFCSGCGQRLVETKSSSQAKTRCPSCGFENLDAFRFCSKCGQELRGEGEPAAPSADTSQSAHPRPQRAAAETAPAPASPPKSNNSAPPAPSKIASSQAQREIDTSKAKDASSLPSSGPVPAALGVAGIFLLITAGAWVISAIVAIGYGDLNALIGVWNLLVCVVIVLVAIQLFKGNAKSRSTAVKLFNTNLLLMTGQMGLFGEMMDETVLIFDLIGLATLGIQAAILWLSKKRIESWWQAKRRLQRSG